MNTPRDLSTTIASTAYEVNKHERSAAAAIRRASQEPDDPHQYSLLDVPKHLARGLLHRYARGDSLESLRQYFHEGYRPTLEQAIGLSAKFFPDHALRMHFEQPASWMLLFGLVCFDEDGALMAHLDNWFTPDCNPVLYAMVRKAFVQGAIYDPKLIYKDKDKAMPHEEQVVSALLQPASTWPHALGAYMKQWPRLMKPYGYRESVEENRGAFDYFPLHLGLAVCAFDVDDSGFRHLPYYPHELVDYYRSHIRNTRDAWRSVIPHPGEGLPEGAKPQPKKTYVLNKTEAYGRWIELVCGGQPALVDAARQALGKRKTMPAIDLAMEALASVGLGIHADLKDDTTLAAQATALCHSWKLSEPSISDTAQQGPARITLILDALQDLDTTQGQRLAVIDDDSGNWNAILFSYAHEAEFTTLCQQLGIQRMNRSQWQ